MNYYNALLGEDSSYSIVDTLLGLVNHLTSVDISDEDWRQASEAIVEVLGKSARQKVYSRYSIHQTTIINELNKINVWGDAVNVMNQMLSEEGILNYIINGMEKDPDVPWSEVLDDTNNFLHSEMMKDYTEGSFWKDMYYFLDFLSDSLKSNQ